MTPLLVCLCSISRPLLYNFNSTADSAAQFSKWVISGHFIADSSMACNEYLIYMFKYGWLVTPWSGRWICDHVVPGSTLEQSECTLCPQKT